MKDSKFDVLRIIIVLIVFVAVFGSLYNIPANLTTQVIQWLVSVFIGAVFSIMAGSLVEVFTGDIKNLFLNIPINENINFPISLFAR